MQAALAARAETERLAPAQRVTLSDRLPLDLLHVEVSLRNGDQAAALARLRTLQRRLPPDLLERVPALAAVASKPEFAALLAGSEKK